MCPTEGVEAFLRFHMDTEDELPRLAFRGTLSFGGPWADLLVTHGEATSRTCSGIPNHQNGPFNMALAKIVLINANLVAVRRR